MIVSSLDFMNDWCIKDLQLVLSQDPLGQIRSFQSGRIFAVSLVGGVRVVFHLPISYGTFFF